MSSARIKEGLEGIAKEVLEDIQKEAESIIIHAKEEAKSILQEAKDESNRVYSEIMVEAKKKASFEKRRIDSKTDVEIRNQLLLDKEALMDLAFKRAQLKLNDVVNSDIYHDYLLGLIGEAAKRIGSKSVVVQVNSRDKVWLAEDNTSLLSKKLHMNLKLAEETIPCLGGCRVQTSDGKLVYDNTLENRIQQLKPLLRLEIANILFRKEDPENVS